MRIAFLSNGLFPYVMGGMQKHSVMLVRHLPDNDVEVDLYYVVSDVYPEAQAIHEKLFASNPAIRLVPVNCPRLPYFPGHHYPESYWKSRALRKAVERQGGLPDFIYAQGYMGWSSIAARRASRSRLAPVGANFHGLNALQDDQNLRAILKNCLAPIWLKWNLRNADCVLSLGGALDQIVRSAGVPQQRVVYSHNGIDSGWIKAAPRQSRRDNRVRFLFVGRDTACKGFTELDRAIRQVLREPWFEFHFVGSIAEKRQIYSERVTYHGSIFDEMGLKDMYDFCDVLVCPSHSEGMPTVILEATARGLPVIATDVGAVRLMVDDENGWLIPSRDSDALVKAMRKAASADLHAKGLTSLSKVERFRWDIVARNTMESIRSSLSQHTMAKS